MSRTPSGPTRAERRAQQGNGIDDGDEGAGRSRRGLVIAGVVALILILGVGAAFALGVFSGGSSEEAAPRPSTNVKLTPGEIVAYWPGLGPTPIPDGLEDSVMGVIGDYVDSAIVPGLRTGKVDDAALASAFDQAAIATLAGDDRTVVLDEGLPKSIGKLTITSTPVNMTVLNDNNNNTLLVTAAIELDIRVVSDAGPYDIKRLGQLEFAPDGAGGWKITGWDLDVSRTGKGLPAAQQTPTTTAVAGTPTSAPVAPTTT